MDFKKELKRVRLPKTYMREGKKCYYDPYRKKLIEITPEETVRQRMAAYCEKILNVPYDMISVEIPVVEYGSNEAWRCDIVIHKRTKKKNEIAPLAIIECKNEDVPLTHNVFEQADDYRSEIGGDYIILTNGTYLEMYAYSPTKDDYKLLDGVLSYDEMLKGKRPPAPKAPNAEKRFNIEQLNDIRKINRYSKNGAYFLGEDTPRELRPAVTNLYQAFMETSHTLPKKSFKTFKVVEDLGLRFMDYTNAGGGHFCGEYRAFFVKDRFGEMQIVSFQLMGTNGTVWEYRGEHRNSFTVLCVAIDNLRTIHNTLQLSVDKYAEVDGRYMYLWHDGRNSKYKNEVYREYVRDNAVRLEVEDNRINLGKLPIYKLIHLDNAEVAAVIYNLIEYALLREEIRQQSREALTNT